MFPNAVFLGLTTCLAIVVAGAPPFSSWCGLLKNVLIAVAVTYVAIGSATLRFSGSR